MNNILPSPGTSVTLFSSYVLTVVLNTNVSIAIKCLLALIYIVAVKNPIKNINL